MIRPSNSLAFANKALANVPGECVLPVFAVELGTDTVV